MKNNKLLCTILSLITALCIGFALVGCDPVSSESNIPEESDSTASESIVEGNESTPDTDKPYTVKFLNGETVVYETTAATGDYVDIPDAPVNSDERYTFVGWEGIDEADMEAGKIEVFNENVTYNAVWYEQFGSNTVFEAMQVRNVASVAIDGISEDAWLDATAYDLDENGSYVKFMWDAANIYIFAFIADTDTTGDNLEIKVDLLHSEDIATDAWNGVDWGDKYRGNYMVEGGYVVNAGSTAIDNFYWEWLSNGDKEGAAGASNVTVDGYTVEVKIGTSNGSTPDFCKPAEGNEIGLSVRNLNNKTVTLESFNGYMDHGPKSLSNVKFVANENNDKDLVSVKQVRENYSVTVDNTQDLLYKDADNVSFGESTVKMLWDNKGVYIYATLGANTSLLKFSSPLLGEAVEMTTAGESKEIKISSSNEFVVGSYADLSVTYVDGGNNEVVLDYIIKLEANPQNIGRSIYEAKKLAEGQTITLDGNKDEAYGTEATAIIDTIAARENDGEPDNTGKAWIRWDDGYLYVFVEVTDADVSDSQIGEPYANDSVEVWLDTCQQLPLTSTGWGDANRPLGLYRGEGGFRVVAGKVGADSGQHWLWDDQRTRPETASVVTDTGYTVEYKIPWAVKYDEWDDGFGNYIPSLGGNGDKTNQIIDIIININDDDGKDGKREGIVSMNPYGGSAWERPYVLNQLKLVAADAE